jgi:hypothetical protein
MGFCVAELRFLLLFLEKEEYSCHVNAMNIASPNLSWTRPRNRKWGPGGVSRSGCRCDEKYFGNGEEEVEVSTAGGS